MFIEDQTFEAKNDDFCRLNFPNEDCFWALLEQKVDIYTCMIFFPTNLDTLPSLS